MPIASFLCQVMDFVPTFKGDTCIKEDIKQRPEDNYSEDDYNNEAVLLIFSRRFLNCLTPYVISDRCVFRTEFDIMLNLSDTFQFATKIELDRLVIPDSSVQLKALRLVKHQVSKVEFSGFKPTSPELGDAIKQELCECRNLSSFEVDLEDDVSVEELEEATELTLHVFRNHPFLHGQMAACSSLFGTFYNVSDEALSVIAPKYLKKQDSNTNINKDDLLSEIVEKIFTKLSSLSSTASDSTTMMILDTLLRGVIGCHLLDLSQYIEAVYSSAPDEQTALAKLCHPLYSSPHYERVFHYFEEIAGNGDLGRLSLRVLAHLVKLVQAFCAPDCRLNEHHTYGTTGAEANGWRTHWWNKYRDTLIIPLLDVLPTLETERGRQYLIEDAERQSSLVAQCTFMALNIWAFKRNPRLWIDDFGFDTSSRIDTRNNGMDDSSRDARGQLYWDQCMIASGASEYECYMKFFHNDKNNQQQQRQRVLFDHLPLDRIIAMDTASKEYDEKMWPSQGKQIWKDEFGCLIDQLIDEMSGCLNNGVLFYWQILLGLKRDNDEQQQQSTADVVFSPPSEQFEQGFVEDVDHDDYDDSSHDKNVVWCHPKQFDLQNFAPAFIRNTNFFRLFIQRIIDRIRTDAEERTNKSHEKGNNDDDRSTNYSDSSSSWRTTSSSSSSSSNQDRNEEEEEEEEDVDDDVDDDDDDESCIYDYCDTSDISLREHCLSSEAEKAALKRFQNNLFRRRYRAIPLWSKVAAKAALEGENMLIEMMMKEEEKEEDEEKIFSKQFVGALLVHCARCLMTSPKDHDDSEKLIALVLETAISSKRQDEENDKRKEEYVKERMNLIFKK